MPTDQGFQPNDLDEFAKSPAMQAEMLQRAEAGAAFARGLAAGHVVTGAFLESIGTTSEVQDDRAVAYVVATDEAASHIEFGTNDTVGLDILARTADYLRNG